MTPGSGALALAATVAGLVGCQAAPHPEPQRIPAAKTTVQVTEPTRSHSIPVADDCGLGGYPVSRPTREIVAAVPRPNGRPRNSMMHARIAIDREGRITHLRVLNLAYPEASNAVSLNEEIVDSIKRRHYAPIVVAGKPVAVCSDIEAIVDFH